MVRSELILLQTPILHGSCEIPCWTWVISHVPMFHITQPLGIWMYMVFFMATIFGDVQ